MSALTWTARATGCFCVGVGALQMLGGTRAEPGIDAEPTTDSHIRFMGPVFVAYGLRWLRAASGPESDLRALRELAGLMAAGGASRLLTRATLGERPHRFHDVLMATELSAPIIVEALASAAGTRRG